ASRELFARVIKNPEWFQRLDAAETGPEEAANQYRVAMSNVSRAVSGLSAGLPGLPALPPAIPRGPVPPMVPPAADLVPAKPRGIPVRPCDAADETVYLLFLGTFPGTERVIEGDTEPREVVPAEHRLIQANGMSNGVKGEALVVEKNLYDGTVAALAPGSDRVFGKLLAAWLPRRNDPTTLHCGFECAVQNGAPEVLAFARAMAADEQLETVVRCGALS